MATMLRTAFTPAVHAKAPSSRARSVRVMAADFSDKAPPGKGKLEGSGYIVDNSAKGNVFPTTSKPYIKSETAERVAADGPLGGLSGLIILGAVVAGVGALAFGAIEAPPPATLESVVAGFEGDALTAIAGRIAASL